LRELSSKERFIRQIKGQSIDRVPTIGGWIGGVENLANLAAIPVKEYLESPFRGVIKAYKALDVDGLVGPVIPKSVEEIRTDYLLEKSFAEIGPEALVQKAEMFPDSEKKVLAQFDATATEQRYRNHFESAYKNWEGMVPIPNFWEIGGPFPLYQEFGYSAFFMACAIYPEAVTKIWWVKSLLARESAKILVGLYKEYDLVPLLFCGEDLCNNKGPMVSPDFLRENYFPLVKMIIEPLVENGIRLIHHCDGDVRPIVNDIIEIGFAGLQGFQFELGIDPYEFKKLKNCFGQDLLFFTGLSVSRTLPFGTAEDVKEEIDFFLDFTDGGKGMFLFTTNVTGVEVPPANLRTAYSYIRKDVPGRKRNHLQKQWPWSLKHSNTEKI
jgi:hypothetical protein